VFKLLEKKGNDEEIDSIIISLHKDGKGQKIELSKEYLFNNKSVNIHFDTGNVDVRVDTILSEVKELVSVQEKDHHRDNMPKSHKICMVGLDRAGKTSLLQRMKLGRFVERQRPTIGMNAEVFLFREDKINIWDLGGQLVFRRALWVPYTKRSSGLVIVIDISAKFRLPEVRGTLRDVLELSHLQGLPVVICCNKIDLSDEDINEQDIINFLGLQNTRRHVKVFPTSAKTGTNVGKAFSWIIDTVIDKTKDRGLLGLN